MAVSNAIGTWMEHYPATPEKVLETLGKGRVRRDMAAFDGKAC
jgi:hypothetical protein